MNDLLKQYKQDYLAGLKSAKSQLEAKAEVRKGEIYAQKSVAVAEKQRELEVSLQAYIDGENEKLAKRIQEYRNQVQEKKQALETEALAQAAAEARIEVSAQIAEIDNEINVVVKSLGE